MSKAPKNTNNAGSWIAIGTAIGAAIFALTGDPVWIGVGVALGAALGSARADKTKEKH
jgi:hypothetical protein